MSDLQDLQYLISAYKDGVPLSFISKVRGISKKDLKQLIHGLRNSGYMGNFTLEQRKTLRKMSRLHDSIEEVCKDILSGSYAPSLSIKYGCRMETIQFISEGLDLPSPLDLLQRIYGYKYYQLNQEIVKDFNSAIDMVAQGSLNRQIIMAHLNTFSVDYLVRRYKKSEKYIIELCSRCDSLIYSGLEPKFDGLYTRTEDSQRVSVAVKSANMPVHGFGCLDITTRTKAVLRANNINGVYDIKSKSQLISCKNIGSKTLEEIVTALKKVGITIPD